MTSYYKFTSLKKNEKFYFGYFIIYIVCCYVKIAI